MSTFEIKNKIALVTGANRGIGKAYVKALVDGGAKKVYATARDLKKLEALVAEAPDVIEPLLLDVTNVEHIKALKAIPALDILINNAGILVTPTKLTSHESLEASRAEMETNYFGPLQITTALIPKLRGSSEAAIINVGSIVSITSMASIGTYSISKAAVHSLTQGLRGELSAEGIRVVGVYPGPIDTEMAASFDMEKPHPSQVADKTFQALATGEKDVWPDDFSSAMREKFLANPEDLEEVFGVLVRDRE